MPKRGERATARRARVTGDVTRHARGTVELQRRLFPGLHLLAQALLLLTQLRRELGAKILGLEHLADLDFFILERGALQPFDRLFLRFHLPHPKARDQLLGLGEWAVDHGRLPTREPDPRTLRACLETFARE